MKDVIHLLPDAIANQIAAGEVVQRPASAVKELMENAIDAGATDIQLIVKDAGKTLIQVVDNGIGMSETDARMCFERHATSKISKSEDLFHIKTMGFRGEALASIAAIAQVELKTQREEDEVGVSIQIDGSEFKNQDVYAGNTGTSISVKNLFFNVPARRNFLKSNQVELKHIIDEFQRIALSHPEISMSMFQNELEIFRLPESKLSQRIVNIFGNQYKEQLVQCEEETPGLRVKGYIGKPEFAKKTRGEQFFFVNNRFIKSGYLHHALTTAYEGLLSDDTHPFYVLFLEIDPARIDINVHPTKTEIKFEDERTVYGIIHAAVKKSLATHHVTPSIDFEHKVDLVSLYGGQSPSNQDFLQKSPLKVSRTVMPPREESEPVRRDIVQSSFNLPNTERNTTSNPANAHSEESNLVEETNVTSFQIHNSYIVTQVKSGMMIIDQQAAHERILFEKYAEMLQKKIGFSQQFLFPESIELSAGDFALVKEMEEEIKSLGFVFNYFSNNTVVVNGIPADVQTGDEKALFEGLIEQFKHFSSELKVDRKETLARSLAKKASIKKGKKLSLEEMKLLIDQLFACKTPNYAPNGDLTVHMLDMDKLSKLFKK